MTNISDDSMSSMNFNDSDIEKEFMQIKNGLSSKDMKGVGSKKLDDKGDVAPASMVANKTRAVGLAAGTATVQPSPPDFSVGPAGPTMTGGQGNRLGFFPSKPNGPNGPNGPSGSLMQKSPKPIPKGIDFGHELIGNPRYFSKNSSGFGGSDEFLSSGDEDLSGGQDTGSENYRRMNNPLSFGNSAYTSNVMEGMDSGNFLGTGSAGDSDTSDRSSRDTNKKSIHSKKGDNTANVHGNASIGGESQSPKGKDNDVNFSKYQELTPSEIYARKEEILIELEKLREKGVRLDRDFDISSDLSDMERTFMRLKTKKDQTSAIKLMKKVLMGVVSGTEYVNQKFNKDNVDLEGWTEHVLINITDYDEIFEELYDKYKAKFAVAPEIKLLMTLFGSAFTFHMSKVLAKQFAPNPVQQTRRHEESRQSTQGGKKFEKNPRSNDPAFQSLFASKGPADDGNQDSSSKGNKRLRPATGNTLAAGPDTREVNGAKKGRLTSNLAEIFGGQEGGRGMKGNDELDEIIREMENNQNNLSLPEDLDDTDQGYDEILSDSHGNESTDDLNEIQSSNNLLL